ncbi:MAG: phospho-sugar mutase, partial [Oscillospiraceae bacterium]|nr:phospho-sugar mutase [Oscillospiraceae bacterium]
MSARSEYDKWRASPALSDAERRELLDIADDAAEIESRFFAPLAFGTAGLRGVMALGTNRINVHVIRHATQAFAEVILEKLGGGEVAVCRDCRINSLLFAQEAASVLAGNGIRVRIFDDIRPTPELSFAIRKYGCAAGINITASHNTKEYNGYKVYLSDGAQLPPREARWVAERMEGTDIFASIKRVEYGDAVARGIITVMGEETDEAFLAEALGEAAEPQAVAAVADRLRVVYTPFHGAGYKLVPEALRRLGVRHLYPVPEQMTPDGTFPTVESPNPELPEGFALAGRLAREVGADIIIGTDPDSDRIAVLVRDGAKGGADNPDYVHLSGNKTGVLLIDYVLASKKRAGVLPENPVVLKTIVTTDMARRAARLGGARCFDTFTGFKFMAERKGELESSGEGNVVFSYEESYGYMAGDYVRDKDAVTAAVLITAMTAH